MESNIASKHPKKDQSSLHPKAAETKNTAQPEEELRAMKGKMGEVK